MDRAAPPGFRYQPEVVDAREALALQQVLPLLRGNTAPDLALPDCVLALRAHMAALVGVHPQRFRNLTVAEHRSHTATRWERAAPAFELLAVISLSAAQLQFRRPGSRSSSGPRVPLDAGSVFFLSGAARWYWQSRRACIEATHWSLTFRTLRMPCAKTWVAESPELSSTETMRGDRHLPVPGGAGASVSWGPSAASMPPAG